MYAIKTPYYPNKQLYVRTTPLGALVVYPEPDIYDKPIPGKTILKVDAVKSLKELWGESTVRCRDLVFRLVSGDCSEELYRETLISMYKRFKEFSNYVDEKWLFGDRSETPITRIVKPARDFVDNKIIEIKKAIAETGGKFLMCTHDYVYAAYSHNNIPILEHSEVIKC